jgi:hypothetical protein
MSEGVAHSGCVGDLRRAIALCGAILAAIKKCSVVYCSKVWGAWRGVEIWFLVFKLIPACTLGILIVEVKAAVKFGFLEVGEGKVGAGVDAVPDLFD